MLTKAGSDGCETPFYKEEMWWMQLAAPGVAFDSQYNRLSTTFLQQ